MTDPRPWHDQFWGRCTGATMPEPPEPFSLPPVRRPARVALLLRALLYWDTACGVAIGAAGIGLLIWGAL